MSGRTGVRESVFVETKSLGMGYLRLILVSTETRIGDELLDGYGCTVAKKECRDTQKKKIQIETT